MDDLALISNATATYDEIESLHPPVPPLQFPDPVLGRAVRTSAVVYNPDTDMKCIAPNVIYRAFQDQPFRLPNHAYLIGKKLKKAIYGCVRASSVLRLREETASGGVWEYTTTMAAVKIIDWNAVRLMRGRHTEDPVKEVACMQYISQDGRDPHPNVLGTWDVLADEQYLYSFMPFCSGGEMFTYVERDGRFKEPLARFWFKQILQGLYHLQRMGICHRDISLENILVDANTKCLVIDMGMCLRVPFLSDDGESIVDVSRGTMRCLIASQGPCGKPNYISPEILKSDGVPFDGFAVDLWAAGVILFIMLVGLPPFELAADNDPRFRMITQGGLVVMIENWGRGVSSEAGDLLQRMLRKHPSERLSIMDVMEHPWVINPFVSPPSTPENEGWRF